MSWLEAHQSLRDHPKRDRLSELLFLGTVPDDVADLASIGILLNLWWWAIDYARDGDLTKFSDRQIAKGCGYVGDSTLLVQSLTDAGFIDKKPRRIHDWDEYGGTLIAKKARDAARKRESRKHAVHGTSGGHLRDGAGTDLPLKIKSNLLHNRPVDNVRSRRARGNSTTSDAAAVHGSDNGNGQLACWRCERAITGDEVLDDLCVVSRRGTRHKECAP